MPWVSLDDKFHGHDKIVQVGNAGAGLYARALSRCGDYLTDGFVSIGWAREVAPASLRKKLTDAALWLEVKGGESFNYLTGEGELYPVEIPGPGYFIGDYLLLNPTAAEVKLKRSELSAKRSEAGKKGAMKRWHPDGKPDGKAIASASQTDSPLPLPLKNTPKAVTRPPGTAQEITTINDQIDQSLKEAS